MTLEGLISYEDYLEVESVKHSSEKRRAYDKYRESYLRRHDTKFFELHKNEDWFRERYDPSHQEHCKWRRRETLKLALEQAQQEFKAQLSRGSTSLMFPFKLAREGEEDGGQKKGDDQKDADQKDADKKEEGDKEDGKEEPKFAGNCIKVGNVPASAERDHVLKLFKDKAGYVKLLFSKPDAYKDFLRTGYAFFDNQENCTAAFDAISQEAEAKEFALEANKQDFTTLIPFKLCKETQRLSHDLKQALELCAKLDDCRGLTPVQFEEKDEERNRLETVLCYLRNVHLFSYFKGKTYTTEDNMMQADVLTEFASSLDFSDKTPWGDQVDQRVAIRKAGAEREKGLNPIETTEQRLLEAFYRDGKNIIEKGVGKFKCGHCVKQFKAVHFVEKHLKTKHGQLIEELQKKVAMEEKKEFQSNYRTDEKRPYQMVVPPKKEREKEKEHDDKDKESARGEDRVRDRRDRGRDRGRDDTRERDRRANDKRVSSVSPTGDRDGRGPQRGADADADVASPSGSGSVVGSGRGSGRDGYSERSGRGRGGSFERRGARGRRGGGGGGPRANPTPSGTADGRGVISYEGLTYKDPDAPEFASAVVEDAQIDYGFGDFFGDD